MRPKSPPNPPRSPRVSSPQATATEVGNRWSSNLRDQDPVDTQKKDETPNPAGPGVPVSYAPKYTDDDGDLRDTAATPKAASTQESRGGIHNYANTPYPEHPGEAPELKPAEVRHHCERSSYMSSRGSRTSARPAENRTNRRFIVQHILAREAGEPFIYAVIRNKAITRERVTAEEWKKASETSHIVFPNRDSEWSAVLDRAVHNDYMYGALDASRAAGRIDQEYINPRDRKSTPWADQQWNMKKVAAEAAHIPLGMRQDIQAKYHHGRAPAGDWADRPDQDDYMVRGVVSDPNRRAYDCLRAPGVRATLLNAQTGQCIPLDDPTWVPEIASSHLLVGTIATIASHVDCALGRAWRMPMFHPQLMAATEMLEKLQKYFNALNEAVVGKRFNCTFQHDSRSPRSGVADYPDEGADARHTGAISG